MSISKFIKTGLFLSFVVIAAYAQPNLSGVLLNEDMVPINSAAVKLLKDGSQTTTSATGAFKITGPSIGVIQVPPSISSITISGRSVRLSLPNGIWPVNIKVYNTGGRLLGTMTAQLSQGVHLLTPPLYDHSQPAATRVLIIRIEIAGQVFIHRAIQGGSHTYTSHSLSLTPVVTLSKATAASAADTLYITKAGFSPMKIMLSSVTDVIDTLIMARVTGYPREVLYKNGFYVSVYTPDRDTGYYRSSRFDWTGQIGLVKWLGHTAYGDWKFPHDPTNTEHATGPAEEFDQYTAPGFSTIGTDGVYLKIGVGGLRRATGENNYSPYPAHTISEYGTRTITRGLHWVTHTHSIPAIQGWRYFYTKTITLGDSANTYVIDHSLNNTGTKVINTVQYNHNLTTFDGEFIDSAFKVIFPFKAIPKSNIDNSIFTFQDNTISFHRIMDNIAVYTPLDNVPATVEANAFTIWNIRSKVGMKSWGDQVLNKMEFFSFGHIVCPEPFIDISVNPGQTKSWKYTYKFMTMP